MILVVLGVLRCAQKLALQHARDQAEDPGKKERRLVRWFRGGGNRLSSMAPKLRNLVTLVQTLKGSGFVFQIPFPPLFQMITQWLGAILEVNLPDLVPIDCIQRMGYFAEMVLRTGLPLMLYMLLKLLETCLRRKIKREAARAAEAATASRESSSEVAKPMESTSEPHKASGELQPFTEFLASTASTFAFVVLYLVFPMGSMTTIQCECHNQLQT